ncbi:hypothetical protein [Vulcanisaeta sp. JCM 16159]|uniref:hypothetical protein n=1 Tax=Vulcanisaeta sp. JCM 16159 TaxID=1295371 RepID=UPI000AC6161E|nr:hypothetical protein [Vulcanisaeta sp. JCM 16159]
MGEVLFPQSSTPYIVVQWDPVWQNTYRQVGVVGQWNVWIIGPNGQVIKAWNGIGVGSINLTTLMAPKQLNIIISYNSSNNILTGIVYAGYLTKHSTGTGLSFFILNLSNYFILPKSSSYIFGIGSATGLHYGEWYLISESYYNVADNYVSYVQGSSNAVLSTLKGWIDAILMGVGLPSTTTATPLIGYKNLLDVDFSHIIYYIVRIFINNYNYDKVIYVPIPNQLTINLTDLLWPQEAYTGGNGFNFIDPIYIVFIPQGNDYSVVSGWNPFLDMYSYANYNTNYSPGGNCYGFSSTAILYFDRYVLGEDTINGLVVPYYPLQNYGPTSTPTATAQLYLGQVNSHNDLIVSSLQYPLTPAALEIAIHQIFDPYNHGYYYYSGSSSIPNQVEVNGVWITLNDFNDLVTYLNPKQGAPTPVILAMQSWSYSQNKWNVIAHAVVAWGYAKLVNGSYAILVSDPDYPGTIRVAIYNPSTGTFSYTSSGYTFTTFYVVQPTPAEWNWFISSPDILTISTFSNQLIESIINDLYGYTVIAAPSSSIVSSTLTNLGVVSVVDGGISIYAVPNSLLYQFIGNLVENLLVLDPPVNESVGAFIMSVSRTSAIGFLVNVTSSKPVTVTIGLAPNGLVIKSNSSASLNVTGFYMSSTKVVVNSTTAKLEPSKASFINSTELIGVNWASVVSIGGVSNTSSVVSPSPVPSSTGVSSSSGYIFNNVVLPIVAIALAVVAALFIIYIGLLRRRGLS